MTRVKAGFLAARVARVRASIGHRIRRERTRLGLTQEQLAERLNVSPNYLAHLERGSRGATLHTLVAIAARLEISFRSLFDLVAEED